MNVLSTFSGVGGLDLGLHQAGWRHELLCERDEYRRAVLNVRFPGVPILDDVRRVHAIPDAGEGRDGERGLRAAGRDRRPARADGEQGAAGRPDLLCGGFPCQDLSVAGRRAGLNGERSGLFFEFARIAESVRPRWLLIENVPGLLSSNGGRDFGELLGTLADVGYGVAWRVLDSRHFGVPQRRRRVFIVACDVGGRAGAERAGQVLAVGSGCDGHPATGGEAGAGVAATLTSGSHDPGVNMPGRRKEDDVNLVVNALDRQAGGADDNSAQANHLTPIAGGVRRLTPRECERLQGFPDDWTLIDWRGKPAPDSRRYASLGDAVTVPVARWLGERLAQAVRQEMREAA